MFSNLMARMVERAMPADLGDPHQEWIAAEAAENAIRQTLRIAVLVGLLLLLAGGALAYKYLYLGAQDATVAATVPADAMKQLGADNAKLMEQNQDLQKKIDGLTKERETLQARVTDLEKQVAEAAKKPEAAVAAAPAAPAPQPPPAAAPAPKPAAPAKAAVAPKPAPRPVKQAKASPPPKPRPAAKAVEPAESFQCGDGRTVPDPTLCTTASTAASPATDQLDPRRTYQCGDGRSVTNPAECRPPSGAPSAR